MLEDGTSDMIRQLPCDSSVRLLVGFGEFLMTFSFIFHYIGFLIPFVHLI